MIKIEIFDTDLIERKKRDGTGSFYLQTAYAHLFDQDGNQKRFPDEIQLFVRKSPSGEPIPYAKGIYKIAGSSFKSEKGRLQLDYLNIVPANPAVSSVNNQAK